MNKKSMLTLMFWGLTIVGAACTNTSSATQMAIPTTTLSGSPTRTVSPQPTMGEIPTTTFAPSPTISIIDIPTEDFPANLPFASTPIVATTQRNTEAGLIVTLGEITEPPWYPGVAVFSPDGKIIALATERIRFWDVETLELIRELKNPYADRCYLSHAVFSPDGSLFAVSISSCWGREPYLGHLLVWNFEKGELLQDWIMDFAHMVEPRQTPYDIFVDAFTFIPGSSKIAYATGNQVVIRDVLDQNEPPLELSLGPDMYASELSIRDDGRFIFVLMDWEKVHTWPAAWKIEFKVQIWQLETETISRVLEYPEFDYEDESMFLHGEFILYQDYVNGTLEIHNLSTDEIVPFPYRYGRLYFNTDLSLMICARIFDIDADERIIELWDTDRWRNIFSFLPDYDRDWRSGFNMVTYSPDSTILAIVHREQVSLWNIQPVVQP